MISVGIAQSGGTWQLVAKGSGPTVAEMIMQSEVRGAAETLLVHPAVAQAAIVVVEALPNSDAARGLALAHTKIWCADYAPLLGAAGPPYRRAPDGASHVTIDLALALVASARTLPIPVPADIMADLRKLTLRMDASGWWTVQHMETTVSWHWLANVLADVGLGLLGGEAI